MKFCYTLLLTLISMSFVSGLSAQNKSALDSAQEVSFVLRYPLQMDTTAWEIEVYAPATLLNTSKETRGWTWTWMTSSGDTVTGTDYRTSFSHVGTDTITLIGDSAASEMVCVHIVRIFQKFDAINETELSQSISIYPNPSNGKFVLSMDNPIAIGISKKLKIELLNIQGQQLYSEQLLPDSYRDQSSMKKEMDFSGFAKGIYLLKIATENGMTVNRLVLE